jgi:hypothetical protein
MTELYLCEHQDNSRRFGEITKLIRDFFEARSLAPKRLIWPSDLMNGEDHGHYNINSPIPETLKAKIKKPFIALNGHGYFHGRTYFLVKQFRGDLAYVHIDAHPDGCFGDPDKIRGASFVNNILRLPNIKEVCLVGSTYETIRGCLGWYDGDEYTGSFNEFPTAVLTDERTRFFFGRGGRKKIRKDLYDDSGHVEDLMHIIKRFRNKYFDLQDFDPKTIATEEVYFSVDMDAIKGFPSEWQKSGVLSLEQVLQTISKAGKKKRIVGADICGLALAPHIGKDFSEKEIEAGLEAMFQVYSVLRTNIQ